ncbi:restriction endonuclease [Deinococcus detaillensis]|uniref:Restriction endonuclease n=1 Tax=Deinococcus detaillensis TaxID=2592048 RepID=A0A553V119_9DEIO|nr:restriction endonuclease [Deinococcus detaillensis]TSA86133.1 restriction endonuclease [Deinococcus detaillensis]
MAVLDYQTLMRPLLEALQDGQVQTMQAVTAKLVAHFQLTQRELEELLPSGRQTTFANRVGWAKTYLSKAQVVQTVGRGNVQITARGRELLERVSGRIVQNDLKVYPEFQAFKVAGRGKQDTQAGPSLSAVESIDVSPEEQLDQLYTELSAALADELLSQVRALTPQQFEILVVQLLVAMGYGGSVRDAGQALGRSGDNGIDGVVKQDPLGLDKVYIQAKQWASNVGSQEVRNFSDSLTYHKASKGVLITTAGFSPSANDTARQIGNIILIDGETLAELMIQYGVGVITRTTYQIKKVDSDFFEGI